MKKLLHFKISYFLLAILLFVVEFLIALYMHDNIIRPFVGDVLVVILLYCFVRSMLNIPSLKIAVGVLIFAFIVEILQYFHFVSLIGLGQSPMANILMGNYFTWTDLLAYTLGTIIVFMVDEKTLIRNYFKGNSIGT